jgi:hypothetical protein
VSFTEGVSLGGFAGGAGAAAAGASIAVVGSAAVAGGLLIFMQRIKSLNSRKWANKTGSCGSLHKSQLAC